MLLLRQTPETRKLDLLGRGAAERSCLGGIVRVRVGYRGFLQSIAPWGVFWDTRNAVGLGWMVLVGRS